MADSTIQALDIRVLPFTEGDEHATLVALEGLGTPFAGPDGQPVVIPVNVFRFPMSKNGLKDLIESAQEVYDALPDPKPQSNIVVPGNPQDVDKIANEFRKFTG